MSKTSKRVGLVAGGLVGLALAGGIGGAAGYGLGSSTVESSAGVNDPTRPSCNLDLTWDRDAQQYRATYDDDGPRRFDDYGRTANVFCSDGEILVWQEQRRADGLDDAVCRPVLREDAAVAAVYAAGCAVPVEVVDDEPR
jgi:hypothetical protein